jgi:pimeloyl-ACP methyl ester carboxylesterase
MSLMGEGNTIVNHPNQIEALVAAGQDPVASMTNMDELRAFISPDGWQPSLETGVSELKGLKPSTLLVWGNHDPLGGSDAARQVTSAIPDARLELVDSGHGPWLGHPDHVANLVSTFITGRRT